MILPIHKFHPAGDLLETCMLEEYALSVASEVVCRLNLDPKTIVPLAEEFLQFLSGQDD